jgi:hypothetical protein
MRINGSISVGVFDIENISVSVTADFDKVNISVGGRQNGGSCYAINIYTCMKVVGPEFSAGTCESDGAGNRLSEKIFGMHHRIGFMHKLPARDAISFK